MNASPADPTGTPVPATGLAEIRYSLPDLLREVQDERAAPAYANEKLDQVEISKLFRKKRPARATKQGK